MSGRVVEVAELQLTSLEHCPGLVVGDAALVSVLVTDDSVSVAEGIYVEWSGTWPRFVKDTTKPVVPAASVLLRIQPPSRCRLDDGRVAAVPEHHPTTHDVLAVWALQVIAGLQVSVRSS